MGKTLEQPQSDMTVPAVDLSQLLNLSDEGFFAFASQQDNLRVERRVDGSMVIMAPTGGDSSISSGLVVTALNVWTAAGLPGVVLDSNGGVRLQDSSVRIADAAWITRERWEALSAKQRSQFPPIAPDFIVEIVSPTDRPAELRLKMRDWIDNGVRLAWLVDPMRRFVEIYRTEREPELLENPSEVQGDDDVLPGFVLSTERIFVEPEE